MSRLLKSLGDALVQLHYKNFLLPLAAEPVYNLHRAWLRSLYPWLQSVDIIYTETNTATKIFEAQMLNTSHTTAMPTRELRTPIDLLQMLQIGDHHTRQCKEFNLYAWSARKGKIWKLKPVQKRNTLEQQPPNILS